MFKIIFLSMVFLLTIFTAYGQMEYPEVKLEPKYPVIDLVVDEKSSITAKIFNNNNFSDMFNLSFSGTYADIAELEISEIDGGKCVDGICQVNISGKSNKEVKIEIEPKMVGKGTLNIVVKSSKTQLEESVSVNINILEGIARGVFNAPDVSPISLLVIFIIAGILFHWLK